MSGKLLAGRACNVYKIGWHNDHRLRGARSADLADGLTDLPHKLSGFAAEPRTDPCRAIDS
jgi:hypothetical protein